jgi:methylated-DNA-[protein]-cysteine S-methyltransferase
LTVKNRAQKKFALGVVTLDEEDGAITRVGLPGAPLPPMEANASAVATPLTCHAFRELEEYFAGTRKTFTVPLAPRGTEFQTRVWVELRKVGYGERVTYGELARRVGAPNAARAVGGAMNKNPLAIFVPCHRVVGSDGSLTGFAGGLSMKEKLLAIEARNDAK